MRTPFRFILNHRTITFPARLSLVSVWIFELSVLFLLLAGVLGFDWWIYRTLVTRRAEIPFDQLKGVTALDKKSIERAAQSIADHEEFLKNPTFSFIPNPF